MLTLLITALVSGAQASSPSVAHTSLGDVRLPIGTHAVEAYALRGSADLDATDALMREAGLHPIPIKGRASVDVWALEYGKGTFEPYKEVVIGILASPRENLGGGMLRLLGMGSFNLFGPPSSYGVYFAKLFVDQPIALVAGNEIWGLNKELAGFDLSPNGKPGFELTDASGRTVLKSIWASKPTKKSPTGLNFRFNSYSPGNETTGQTMAVNSSQGKSVEGPFDAKADTFEMNPATEWGEKLLGIGYRPEVKVIPSSYRVQLAAPRAFKR